VGGVGAASGVRQGVRPEPEVYPLERAAEAIASLENRTAKGKVVLKVREQ
jgi:NADPH2:quinone reductase